MQPCELSLSEALHALESGRLSSVELMASTLERAKRTNSLCNAFIRIDEEFALKQAAEADKIRGSRKAHGRLLGVPMAHKDMFYRAGQRSSCGSFVDQPMPQQTATVLERLDAAGAIQFGVLNMSTFAVGPTGHNADFGHCRNPWDTTRITGGSSSGSAASVASRAGLAALGSDTAGSVRIPAALCGITGIKPTYGRVSRAGVMGFAYSLDAVGVLAQTARDCALVLREIAGPDVLDPTSVAVKVPDLSMDIASPVSGLRVGVPLNYFTEGVSTDTAALMCESLAQLQALGCQVVPLSIPDLSAEDASAAMLIAVEGANLHRRMLRTQGSKYGAQIRTRLERGFAVSGPDYLDALRYRSESAMRFVEEVFSVVDVLHVPVMPVNTPTLDETDMDAGVGVDETISRLTSFTRPFNFLGLPVVTAPVGFDGNRMPVGMQLVGRPFSEKMLLRLADAFQQVTTWHRLQPQLA